MRDWLALVRIHNLLLAAAGVVAGGWIALARVAFPREAVLAALSGFALGAAGNALNDLADTTADRVNWPAGGRPLVAGRVGRGAAEGTVLGAGLCGLATAGLVSGAQVAVAAATLGVMAAYSPLLKRHGVPGNLAVAVVAGLPLWYGALAVGAPGHGVVPWVLAGWLHLVREVVKDVADAPGDRAMGRGTIAVRYGSAAASRAAAGLAAGFVPVSLILPWAVGYRWPYFAAAAPAWGVVLVVARRLQRGAAWHRAVPLLKGAMVVGLVALVLGRIS